MQPSSLSRWFARRLYQALSGRDHPERVDADSAEALVRGLSLIDDRVPPRELRERRHQAHQEWHCLRRYLLALVQAERLAYPLSIRKSESPDFLLVGPGGSVTGLEVSEATTQAHQRQLTATEGDGHAQVIGPAAGWGGDAPEQALAVLVAERVQRKAAGIARNPHWQVADRHDLLLYNNGPYLFQEPQALLPRLREALAPVVTAHAAVVWPHGAPGCISVLTGGHVLYDVTGEGTVLAAPDAD